MWYNKKKHYWISVMNAVQKFNAHQVERLSKNKPAFPVFGPGDMVAVDLKIKDVNQKDGKVRERIQRFEGMCLSRRNAGVHSSFRIRRSVGAFSLERVFKLYSPLIENIVCMRRNKVRRSKIYYIRTLSRKKARLKERIEKPSVAKKTEQKAG
jgi:large subunit ribosomal protein L19